MTTQALPITPATLTLTPALPSTTAALAAAYLDAKRAAERADALKAALLDAMATDGATVVDVPGMGVVRATAGSTRTAVDGRALAVKVGELSALLTAHGIEHDAAVPLTVSALAPSVRVTWAK